MQPEYHVAMAGWSIRTDQKDLFCCDGSHLERYASRFGAVEINSSFYRPHKRETVRTMGRQRARRVPILGKDAEAADPRSVS